MGRARPARKRIRRTRQSLPPLKDIASSSGLRNRVLVRVYGGEKGGGGCANEYFSSASWTVWSEVTVWRCTRRTSSVSGSARKNIDILSLSCSHSCCSDSMDCSLFARGVMMVVVVVVPFCWWVVEDLLSISLDSGAGKMMRGDLGTFF